MQHRSNARRPAACLAPPRLGPAALALLCAALGAQCFAPRGPEPPPEPADVIGSWPLPGGLRPQTDDDESTVYELLEPESGEFHVRYEVSATTPGATAYFNILRKGSGVRDQRAVDLFTGQELAVSIVGGDEARLGGHPLARGDVEYLKIELLRPVPEGGQTRLAIEKIYEDPRGYFLEDGLDNGQLVFARAMNIRRNAVVLPRGYELVSCNHPVQVASADGRIRTSFTKTGQSPVFLVIRARPAAADDVPADQGEISAPLDASLDEASAPAGLAGAHVTDSSASEREVLFDLGDPARHAFRVVTEVGASEPGLERLTLTAPAGTLAAAGARVLDTGAALAVDTTPEAGSERVVVRFPPVEPGQSLRIRVEEERSDGASYGLEDGTLVWRGRCGPALRSLVLPRGWVLAENSLPAAVSETMDGRVRLDYDAQAAEGAELVVRARRR